MDEIGIITATDDKMFYGFQIFHKTLSRCSSLSLSVFDLGLTFPQKLYCDRNNINLVPMQDDLIMPKEVNMWQTWNKPVYLLSSPYKKTLWLDADTYILCDPIYIFDYAEKGFTVFKDYFLGGDCLKNNDAFYSKFPVSKRLTTLPNGGVICFHEERDIRILDEYTQITQECAEDENLRKMVKWWDQGCLTWAMEKVGYDNVIDDRRFNDAYYVGNKKFKDFKSLEAVIEKRDSCVVHFGGRPKPWTFWDKDIYGTYQNNKLKLLVLGHKEDSLNKVPDMDHLVKCNLPQLNLNTKLAESQIYLTDIPLDLDSNYVGFATHRWDEKFSNVLKLSEMNQITSMCKPFIVFTPCKSDNKWIKDSEANHPGINKYLVEIAALNNVELLPRFTPYCNNFICHKSVYQDFLSFFKKTYKYLEEMYNLEFDYWVKPEEHHRKPSFLFERITMVFFASRLNLEIKQIQNAT